MDESALGTCEFYQRVIHQDDTGQRSLQEE